MKAATQDIPIPGGIPGWTRDLAWVLLFAILAFCQEDPDYQADIALFFLAVFQVIEPKLPVFAAGRGQIAALLIKMVLCYLLVGFAHGINSSFYVIFLIPIISAATVLDIVGTVVFIALACFAYASFLFFVNWEQAYFPASDWRLLCLRISFFPVVGLLVYEQARAKREEMIRTEAAALQLAESNRNLRVAQASLRRSERLAALGQLTAGLAHELRNPLGTIKASAELLARPSTQGKPEMVAELSDYISSEVDRTNSLVSRFLDFAKPLELHPIPSDLREAVANATAQVRLRAEAKHVRLEALLPSDPIHCEIDPALLSVALLNLLQNAIDASPVDGVVSIKAHAANEAVRILVTDHGSGIAPDHLESIFNPFFTTKSEGTGLGLAIVSKIIDEHGGKIAVRSDPGKGTQFEVLLPAPKQT